MKPEIHEKLAAFVKSKAPMSDSESNSESDSSDVEDSPMYDLACRLCDALGVDQDKADAVCEVLMDLHDHMSS